MPRITEGNKLYLYQLLSRELGMGKQTLLPRVEEVLAADDILPEDLACDSVQHLMESCPEFIKLTVFKKGRVFATVVRNPEWDKLLEAPAQPTEKAPKAKGGKPWKSKGSVKRGAKPAKPRNKERKLREAQAAAKAEAEAEAKRLAAEEAARAEEEAGAAQAAANDEVPAETPAAPEPAPPAVPQPEPPAPLPTLAEQIEAERVRLGIPDKPEAPSPDIHDDDPDALPSQPPEPAAPPRRRVGRFASALSQDAQLAPAPEPARPSLAPEASEPPAPTSAGASPAPQPDASPQPAHEPSIKLTITYDPTTDDAQRDDARQPPVSAEEFERNELPARAPRRSHPAPSRATGPLAQPSPRADLPETISAEVHARDELLRTLYQMLPVEADLTRVLDEDWRVARSTATLSGSRGKVSFPLRYLHDDGTPVEVTLRRASKPVAGKRWNLAYVDGDDGSGAARDAVSMEGLPAADEGAWADLSGGGAAPEVSPARELAQYAVLGSWDALLGGLASKAEPERWNYPGEGVGQGSRLSILREYLTVTFHRAREQGRLATDLDESFSAFNTGLATPFAQDLFACFVPRRGDIAWKFVGFTTPGAGELGVRLGASLSELPEAPSYLETISDVVARDDRMVILDTEALLSRQLGRLPRAFLTEQLEGNTIAREVLEQELAAGSLDRESVRLIARTIKADPGLYRRMARSLDDAVDLSLHRAGRNFRLSAPAYDPADGRTKLLIPLCLVNDAQVDCAAVLDLQPSGAYRVASVMPLARAYACARVVSAEMPGWLAPEKVLR